MNSNPQRALFTIVTVSYNCCSLIEKTIKSVLQQDYHDTEYIIIDGESTDGTVEIIKKYAQHLAFWCSEPDGGIYQGMTCKRRMDSFFKRRGCFRRNKCPDKGSSFYKE